MPEEKIQTKIAEKHDWFDFLDYIDVGFLDPFTFTHKYNIDLIAEDLPTEYTSFYMTEDSYKTSFDRTSY